MTLPIRQRPPREYLRRRASAQTALVISAFAVVSLAFARPAAAINHLMVIDEVLASWQSDPEIQFIELRMLQPGQNQVQGAQVEILDRDGAELVRFEFQDDVSGGTAGARILIATPKLANLAGLTPDFALPIPPVIPRRGGRICFRATTATPGQTVRVDCVAWGNYSADNDTYGDPTPLTPENRSLQRVQDADPPDNAEDWIGVLAPTPHNNAGDRTVLETLCGNGAIDDGEECDGTNLDGRDCADFGFVGGTLRCTQCRFDTTDCTDCGNGAIDEGEACDGAELGGQTCARLGFTGGALSCTQSCALDTSGCEDLQIPGKGPRQTDCFLEWRVVNPGSPVRNGKPPTKQKCADNDPTCDSDGGGASGTAGACTFRVHLCFNREDARLKGCRPGSIAAFASRRPSSASGDPIDQGNATALLDAAAALGTATREGDVVSFEPALGSRDVCSGPASIVVPLRPGAGGRFRPGRRVIRATATESGGRSDQDKLKLFCLPGS
jgi:hypothetical protein